MKYVVYASKGKIFRREIIDTKRNSVFKGVKTPRGVAGRYEMFWRGSNVQVKSVIPIGKTEHNSYKKNTPSKVRMKTPQHAFRGRNPFAIGRIL